MEQKSSVRRILLTPLLSLSAAVKEQKRVLLVFQCLHQHHQWRQLFTKNLFYVCSEKTLCASSPKKKMSSPRIVKVSGWQVALKNILLIHLVKSLVYVLGTKYSFLPVKKPKRVKKMSGDDKNIFAMLLQISQRWWGI